METHQWLEEEKEEELRCCGCISRKRLIATGYALLAIVSRVGFFIVTPLWLDFFSPVNTTRLNNHTHVLETTYYYLNSGHNASTCSHSASPYFTVLGQWTFSSLTLGLGLALIRLFSPHRIRADVEGSYPKRQFAVIGCSQGVSSMFMAFAISGSRTPPYLQAILTNFALPIQFIVRFAVLRKRPGLAKAICAVVVTLSEVVCLIPTIFPSLENDKQHREEGGSTGIYRFLWPFFFVASQVPFAVSNSLVERGVQSEQKASLQTSLSDDLFANNISRDNDDGASSEHNYSTDNSLQLSRDRRVAAAGAVSPLVLQLNLVYFNFWLALFVVATIVCMFWVDLVPVIGTSSSLYDFGCKMWFNLECLFGGADCVGVIAMLGWLDFCTVLLGNFASYGLMRHSEGANFVMIVLTVRTPIIFLFWTLFVEQPFSWQPHASLGTWLSIGAIVVMVSAIIIYDRAPKEVVPDSSSSSSSSEEAEDSDRRPLIASQSSPANNDHRPTYEVENLADIQTTPTVKG